MARRHRGDRAELPGLHPDHERGLRQLDDGLAFSFGQAIGNGVGSRTELPDSQAGFEVFDPVAERERHEVAFPDSASLIVASQAVGSARELAARAVLRAKENGIGVGVALSKPAHGASVGHLGQVWILQPES